MAIVGGGLLSVIQRHIADLGGLQISYIVPLIAYAYVGFYGLIGHRIGRNLKEKAA
jgi:MFS transporter, FHS family, L-fucose permease